MNLRELVSDVRVNRGLWWQRAWSLVAGCTPVSEACQNCWAATMAHRQGMRQGLSDAQWELWGGLTTEQGSWNGSTRLLQKNLTLPLDVKKPTLFSIWNDLFHPNVPWEFINKAWGTMLVMQRHFFLVLTKRPERLLDFLKNHREPYNAEFPRGVPYANIGIGTTIELPKYEHRLDTLLQIPAALHFVSLEPLLGEVKLGLAKPCDRNCNEYDHAECPGTAGLCVMQRKLDWVLLGCESGSHRRDTKFEDAQKILNECRDAGVPAFLKQIDFSGAKIVHAPTTLTGQVLQFPEVEWKP